MKTASSLEAGSEEDNEYAHSNYVCDKKWRIVVYSDHPRAPDVHQTCRLFNS